MSVCLPHARGGVSTYNNGIHTGTESSPRTWGCFPTGTRGTICGLVFPTHVGVFHQRLQPDGGATVFPTHVGVFPEARAERTLDAGLPHARGGVSTFLSFLLACMPSSPRTWGCFPDGERFGGYFIVFPTHVGVFPPAGATSGTPMRLPHARGGVSPRRSVSSAKPASSPRTWGCFRRRGQHDVVFQVFPTHVGVFLRQPAHPLPTSGLPHARGGVSNRTPKSRRREQSSPRTWGCFYPKSSCSHHFRVFPTHVGVFLHHHRAGGRPAGLPHARGGVSATARARAWMNLSSPRTWGCFSRAPRAAARSGVFPTHVGVFPSMLKTASVFGSLPHARGGVSSRNGAWGKTKASSPRTWGCFLLAD